MAKGDFETKPAGGGKDITINLEVQGTNKIHTITITRSQNGQPDCHGINGPFNDPGVDLNQPSDDTMIITQTNPTCGYYYFNRKWWYI